MKGVLLIAHGSREKDTITTMEQVFDMVKKSMPNLVVERAYMEFCDVNLEKGLDILRLKGVKEIAVVPYFLFSGVHIKKDIPEEIAIYTQKYPTLNIKFGATLGVDERIVAVLCDRIRQTL